MIHRSVALLMCIAVSPAAICWSQDTPVARITRKVQALLTSPLENTAPAPEAKPAHPIVVWVHESTFQSAAGGDVDMVTPVDMMVVGTRARGTNRTIGSIQVECLPGEETADFVVSFAGRTYSRSKGQNGPAIVHSRASTEFRATRRLTLAPVDGLQSHKTKLQAKTTLTITDVQARQGGLRGALVRRIGSNRAARLHGQAEREVAAHSRRELLAEFDRTLDERIASANEQLKLARFVYGLKARPEDMAVQARECDDYLRFALGPKGTGDKDASIVGRPQAPLELWIHQSELQDSVSTLPVPDTLTKLAAAANPLAATLPALQNVLAPSSEESDVSFRSENGWLIASFGRQAASNRPKENAVARRAAN